MVLAGGWHTDKQNYKLPKGLVVATARLDALVLNRYLRTYVLLKPGSIFILTLDATRVIGLLVRKF